MATCVQDRLPHTTKLGLQVGSRFFAHMAVEKRQRVCSIFYDNCKSFLLNAPYELRYLLQSGIIMHNLFGDLTKTLAFLSLVWYNVKEIKNILFLNRK